MNKVDVTIIGFLKAVVVGMMMLGGLSMALPLNQEAAAESQQAESGKININTASLDELMTLPRVGKVIAGRIIEFRKEHEGFKKLEELMNVSGIGRKTYDKLAPLITL